MSLQCKFLSETVCERKPFCLYLIILTLTSVMMVAIDLKFACVIAFQSYLKVVWCSKNDVAECSLSCKMYMLAND